MALLVAAMLALAIGTVLGMLGGGGAILTLPMLVYVLHVEPREAIAMSLVVVAVTGAVSSITHARAGNVKWKIGLVFGGAAMVGAFAGGRLSGFVPPRLLLLLFASLMVATSIAMLRGRTRDDEAHGKELPLTRALVLGAIVGGVSGLVGAGGGFLIVPALVLTGGLPMRQAIGTSLFVVAVQSFAGVMGHAAHVTLDLTLLAIVTSAALVGSLAGAAIGRKVPTTRLRHGFAWLVLVVGILLVGKQFA